MKTAVGSSVRRWAADVVPRRATVKQDLVAGVPGAISSVPDGMAAGVLAVNRAQEHGYTLLVTL